MTPRARSDRKGAPSPTIVNDSELQFASQDPIITMNDVGIIQSASDSIEQVFGWTPSELFGRNVKVLIPEPRRSSLDRYLDRYRRGDKNPVLERTRRFDAVRKDGSVFSIELSMSRADIPTHSGPYFVGIIRDISREIDTGIDTPAHRSRLQQLVTEQTRALATANLRLHLADRLASLGTLAAGLGHDMSNVLLPVQARLNALEEASSTPAALAHVIAVRRSILYLQHLSDALHCLALDPDGPDESSDGRGVTDLAQWWKQIGPLLRSAIPSRVSIRALLPRDLPPVTIAPHWLTQAMLNLIVNAGEAIPPSNREGRIRIRARVTDEGRAVRLSVSDNGRGMTTEVRRRAFDLFYTTKSRSMGTGLGLPLARKVAHRAGGDIEISNHHGKGTTVTLILPTETPDNATAAGAVVQRPSAVVSIRDHRTVVLVSQVLTASGLDVTVNSITDPGEADLWVTKPTLKSLSAAARWMKDRPGRSVALLGAPSASTKARWDALGATTIDDLGDVATIRHALGLAVMRVGVPESTRRTHGPTDH